MRKFAEKIQEELRRVGIESNIKNVTKNNDTTLTGIELETSKDIKPVLYVDNYFNRMDMQKENEEVVIAEFVASAISTLNQPLPQFNVKEFKNFNNVKEKIFFTIVNSERNKALLEECPSMQVVEDLSKIYKVFVDNLEGATATITIKNEHLNYWGIDICELDKIATENTPKLFHAQLNSMSEVLLSLTGELLDEDDIPSGNYPILVVSNNRKLNGASVIFYENAAELFEAAAQLLGSKDIIIIPSSIHEVLLVPFLNSSSELREMIKEVNDTQLVPEEILSYNPYRYDMDTKSIMIMK